jgi:glycosyltransferase involved in cell wall biosynthesis
VPWDLVVTCHSEYLGTYLNECLAGWPDDEIPGKRILVLDECNLSDVKRLIARVTLPGWEIVEVQAGHPSGARNAGLERCTSPWVCFWDADNVPRPGLAREFSRAVGRAAENDGYLGFLTPIDCRDEYGVDTNALWRREAVQKVRGWPWTSLEDWRLGWTLQGAGWRCRKIPGEPITFRRHEKQRSKQIAEDVKLWSARDFAILTLHRGDRRLSERWLDAVQKHDLPLDLAMTVVCDAPKEFQEWLEGEIRARMLAHPDKVRFVRTNGGSLGVPAGISDYELRTARHERVYDLYQLGLGLTPEPWILTWEDDVYPADLFTFRRCNAKMRPWLGSDRPAVAVVGAVYQERYRPGYACASESVEHWVPTLQMDDVETARRVGSTAAGFTLWRRSDLETMPLHHEGRGWDWEANLAASRRGGESWLLADRCEHYLGESAVIAETEPRDVAAFAGLIDSLPEGMNPLPAQLLKLIIPMLVNAVIEHLDPASIKAIATTLVARLREVVQKTPTKVDDETVLPIAEHLLTLLK